MAWQVKMDYLDLTDETPTTRTWHYQEGCLIQVVLRLGAVIARKIVDSLSADGDLKILTFNVEFQRRGEVSSRNSRASRLGDVSPHRTTRRLKNNAGNSGSGQPKPTQAKDESDCSRTSLFPESPADGN